VGIKKSADSSGAVGRTFFFSFINNTAPLFAVELTGEYRFHRGLVFLERLYGSTSAYINSKARSVSGVSESGLFNEGTAAIRMFIRKHPKEKRKGLTSVP
jgi:hypothetical protein